ncbi:MAG TPA: hypothetical protein VM286_10650 [Candidatus Thermoplasmatota archaeon]|nr:hypothetical protein [Candidatus Thermoplasmatota archaeon]
MQTTLPRALPFLGMTALVLLLAVPPVQAAAEPVPVKVTVAVINFGNYDAKQGTYVLDFYLVLDWDTRAAPTNFSAEGFEFANGRATSQELQYDTVDEATGHRTLWYRIQASLYSEPKFQDYPFDHQTVEVRIEDTIHPESELVYVADPKSGLEASFSPAGWEVSGHRFDIVRHEYSFDDPYSQAQFVLTIHRSVLSSVLKVILPPLAFVVISGVSFLLVGADKIATRFALTANMAISAVLFHAGQSASLPSLSRLIFLDRYMLSIDVFVFGSILVTALVALADMKWKDPVRARRINVRGAIAVGIATVLAFLLLQLV